MDTAHFHTGIEQEDAGSQYQVVEVAEVGEEVAVKVHLALSAGSKVNHRQHHQQAGRNDRTYIPPTLATLPTQPMPFSEMKVASQ